MGGRWLLSCCLDGCCLQDLHIIIYLHSNIYIYIYIYIYCHPQTDCSVVSQLFGMAIHAGHLQMGSKPSQIYVRLCIIPLSQQANHVSSEIIRHYILEFFCLHFSLTGYQSAQFIRRALHYASGSRKFLRQSAQHPRGRVYIYIPTCKYIYIYIYIEIYIYIYIFKKKPKTG